MSQLVARRGHDHFTELCPRFMQGWCPYGPSCTFLHGNDDSRPWVLRARAARTQEQLPVPVEAMHRAHGQNGSDQYTAPCWYWPGECRLGDRCTFRHGADDPRALARHRAILDRQPEGSQVIGTHASIALLQWLKGRLHAAKVSILMRTLR
jgi:Zinc finger C-x8-C-x5-C-x3-H type (and similar)/RNA-binding, Nab2-type zinc finger